MNSSQGAKISGMALICAFLLCAFLLAGCVTHSSSPLQNQYGPAMAATRPPEGLAPNFWFSSLAVHPSFALATNWNLGAQVIDQRELSQPRRLGGPNPMAAVGAVDRYQKGQVRALPETSLVAGGGESSN